MRKGFVFKYDLCVACNACVAACYLENDGHTPWRTVLSDNVSAYPGLPVHNLSLACNHCENPVCLESCPANAYYIDSEINAVLLDETKCLGCNYCYWNCPYDAPQYNKNKGTIEKCHLCMSRMKDYLLPACVTACPTGALAYDNLEVNGKETYNIPSNDLRPALSVKNPRKLIDKPFIVPVETEYSEGKDISAGKGKDFLHEWPLAVFSFTSALLFALTFAAWNGELALPAWFYTAAVLLNAFISLLHLGKPLRFFRALSGISSSPLSREIFAYAAFSGFSVPAMIFNMEVLWVLAFLSGLLLLVAIDSVYTYSDKRYSIRFHNAQVFLTGLLFASYLVPEPLPFIFILLIKLAYIFIFKFFRPGKQEFRVLSLIYTAVVIYAAVSMYMPIAELKFTLLFAALIMVEFTMRLIFYFDFSPRSMRFEFSKKTIAKNEK
ncbi:MAG: 4Fe-4S binding protein [Bacteroidales bacterium]|nr:4Fe-4S binding protein [Bacteroidales bacterium]